MLANYSARSARWRTYADVDRSFSSADAAAGAPLARTIALRFYGRGMAVNLYRITSRGPYYRGRHVDRKFGACRTWTGS